MSPETASPGGPPSKPVPRLGIGTIVRHFQFGVGRIVAYEPGQYVIVFRGGDTRRVAFGFDGLEVEERNVPRTQEISLAISQDGGARIRNCCDRSTPSAHQAPRLNARNGQSRRRASPTCNW